MTGVLSSIAICDRSPATSPRIEACTQRYARIAGHVGTVERRHSLHPQGRCRRVTLGERYGQEMLRRSTVQGVELKCAEERVLAARKRIGDVRQQPTMKQLVTQVVPRLGVVRHDLSRPFAVCELLR